MLKKYSLLLSFFSFLALVSSGLHSKIELSVPNALKQETTAEGIKTYTVSSEDEFQIRVSIPAESKNKKKITVNGLDQFQILNQSTSQQMSYVNGTFSGSIHYSITLAAPEEGTFVLGPAKSGSEESDAIKIIVTTPANLPADQAHKDAPRFIVQNDKSTAVLGEPVIMRLRFYPGNIRVTGLDFQQPQTSDFVVSHLEDKEGVENNHRFIERSIKLTPLKIGKRQIGPLRMVYQFAQQASSSDPFSQAFGGMFSHQYAQKTLGSKPIIIDVQEAPATDKETSGAIGRFKDFKISISSLSGETNEPLTLQASVTGEGNLDELKTLKLSLPSSVKYYDSKIYDGPTKETKVFEYILIPRQSGTIEIPQQEFVYFDTEIRDYKTLISVPLRLTIAKGKQESGSVSAMHPTESNDKHNMHAYEKEKHVDDIAFIEEDGPVIHVATKPIPLTIFILIIVLSGTLMLASPERLQCLFKKKSFSHQVFMHEFAILKQKESSKDLYDFFKRYSAERWNTNQSLITQEKLSQILEATSLEKETKHIFLEFFKRCAQASFSNNSHQETASLINEAQEVLELLGKKKV